jgi:hypothetical protein
MRPRPTLILAIVCIALLGGIVATGLIVSSSATSHSVSDVTTEVTTGMNDLQEQLPVSAGASTSEVMRTEPCPDGGAGLLVSVERTIVTADGFDLVGWTRDLSATYNSTEGWSANLEPVRSTRYLTLTLANRALMLFTLRAGTVTQPQTLVMSATSRCSSS